MNADKNEVELVHNIKMIIITELYYLNNRYYDSNTMRFISMDDISYLDYQVLGGLNLFTYCNNNPIMNMILRGI